MGFWDKAKNFIWETDDGFDEEYPEMDDFNSAQRSTQRDRAAEREAEREQRERAARRSTVSAPVREERAPEHKAARRRDDKVVSIHTSTEVQVVIVNPDTFDTSKEIADYLMRGVLVMLNLEKTNRDVQRRIIDFLAGAAYATNGNIQRAGNSIFLVTPNNVHVESPQDVVAGLNGIGMDIN